MDFNTKYDQRKSAQIELTSPMLDLVVSGLGISGSVDTRRLGGGFSNANFLCRPSTGEAFVMRVSKGIDRLHMEADLLRHVKCQEPGVPVPAVVGFWPEAPEDVGLLVMSLAEGQPLCEVEDDMSEPQCRFVCEQIAHVAASFHRIRFSDNGFLGPGPSVKQPFPSYLEGTLGYLEWCLEQPIVKERLGASRLSRLKGYVRETPDNLNAPQATEQLCHGDFNQKNLLVAQTDRGYWELTAVLDWEFALSASGVMDIGNLLRFEHESPAIDAELFAASYRESGGHLDEHWRKQAMFADLLAQLNFLTEANERPRTCSTSLSVIDRYLDAIER